MQQLVLVRHATTDWNLPGRLNSSTDNPLNARGAQEALLLTHYLRVSCPMAAVWSSPATRAQETAAAICQGRNNGYGKIDEAKEVDFGRFEGKTRQELIDTAEGALYETWEGGGEVDDVESLTNAGVRARSVLEHMRSESKSPQHILVSHGVFLRVFICVNALTIAPTAYRKLVVDNASVSLLRIDGDGFRVALLNATNHLESQEQAEE